MSMRTAGATLMSAVLAVFVLVACSSNVAGTAQPLPGGVVPSAASDTNAPTEASTGGILPTAQPATTTSLQPPDSTEPSVTASGPVTDSEQPLPPMSTIIPPGTTVAVPPPGGTLEVPTGLPSLPGSAFPTALPGASAECNAIYQVVLLFTLPLTNSGQPITAAQVETAFAGASDAPTEIRPDLETLKVAAQRMVGKSGTEALIALGDPSVTPAIQRVTAYMQQSCGMG